MTPAIVMLGSLALTMMLFGVALAIAWAGFGRHLHIALWSMSFVASAVGIAGLMTTFGTGLSPLGELVGTAAALSSASLFAQGFRWRAGLTDWRGVAGFTAAAIGVGCAVVLADVPAYCDRAVVDLGDLILYGVALHALRADPRGWGSAARATYWMLSAFCGFLISLVVIAVVARPGGLLPDGAYDVVVLLVMPAAMTGLGLFAMLLLASDLSQRLRRLASCDPLTGVLNRRGFDHEAGRMLAHHRRAGRPVAIVLADLDRFKSINDRFGHALGDTVLRRFAAECERAVRAGDLVGRLGGEEFVLLLGDATAGAAAAAIERLRLALPSALADLGIPMRVTASFGIAATDASTDGLPALLARADRALYGSKDGGRDRISIAPAHDVPAADPRFLAAFAREGAAAAPGPAPATAPPAYGRRS